MKYRDYYKTLGLERGASDDDIKKAYRRLARKYHPDVSTEKDAEERFKEVSAAYETLSNPEKRRAYDHLGHHRSGQDFRPPPDWEKQFGGIFGGAGGIDLESLFGGLTGRRGARPGMRRGGDIEATAELPLEDVARGTEVTVRIGDGAAARTVTARIPRGAVDGQRLKVAGKGMPGSPGPAGDLYITLRFRPHPHLRTNGHDLLIDLPVTPAEAALGTSAELPTLDGKVKLRVPPGSQSGQKLRLGGRGLPRPEGGQGDLYATLRIVLPPTLSPRERELYEQLASASAFDPRAGFL